MLWFQKARTENVEPVATMATLTMSRLVQVEIEFRRAENEFNVAFDRLKRHMNIHRAAEPFTVGNKMLMPLNHHPNLERSRLVHEEWLARSKRDSLLKERADLRKSLGLSR